MIVKNLIKIWPRQPTAYSIAKRLKSGSHTIMDESFVKTSMTLLNSAEGVGLQITSFSHDGFVINQNMRVVGPIMIFPKTIFSWNVEDLSQVNGKSLQMFKMLDPKADVFIIGTGDTNSQISPEVPKWLIQNKITNFEILPTDKAINAFNFLVADNRFVAAALLPGQVFQRVDQRVKRVFERANLYLDEEKEKQARDEAIAEGSNQKNKQIDDKKQ